jgi:hypothetical protein
LTALPVAPLLACGVYVLGAIAMTSKFFVGALASALMLAANFWSCPANALTFQFSFHNPAGNDPLQSLVQGIISGLQDNLANQAAASVQVTSNPAGFGVGEYVGSPFRNIFDVNAGAITFVNFQSLGALNSTPAVICCSLGMGNFGFNLASAGLTNTAGVLLQDSAGLTFTLVAETPLPATLPLFATGLGALGLLGWRRKRKQAA